MIHYLYILAFALLTACGTADHVETSRLQNSQEYDEYDPQNSTHVYHWKISETFWFDGHLNGRNIVIQNVDAVTESMQVYIGSGTRPSFHVYLQVREDLGKKTDRITVIDRLQPHKVNRKLAHFVGRNPEGAYVYRVSLPAQVPYRHEIYAELRTDSGTYWSNQGMPNSFKCIDFAQYSRNRCSR